MIASVHASYAINQLFEFYIKMSEILVQEVNNRKHENNWFYTIYIWVLFGSCGSITRGGALMYNQDQQEEHIIAGSIKYF